MAKGPVATSGGLFFPKALVLNVPHFAQGDPVWGNDHLGPTDASLAAEGCAVASAAMALSARGMDVDPGKLNSFLTTRPDGYTERGWIYWEVAAQYNPQLASSLLPHYEDSPSHFLIDWNLLQGNPVIVRLRYPSGITHFVVIAGKKGFEYYIRDPALKPSADLTPLKAFAGPIEALRFYAR